MGFFKRKHEKNVARDNHFLKSYATRGEALLMYTEENEAITKELKAMNDEFQYTVPTADAGAKEIEKKIKKDFERLTNMLEQTDCDEGEVIMTIRAIRRSITEISSMR